MTYRNSERGVTLMELLIAMTLLSLLSVGIVLSLRVALSGMNKADSKLMANRRVVGVERILEQEVAGLMPVAAECGGSAEAPGQKVNLFQGTAQSMRLASTYSLQQAARGLPMILEYQVIAGENGEGVRLVVNEHIYTGPRSAGAFCGGASVDPQSGVLTASFAPVQIGPGSFVLADKLEYCRLSYRDVAADPAESPKWLLSWNKPILPSAVRFEMAPLVPDPGRVQPVTLTIPVHVTRRPLEPYGNQ